MEEKIEDINKQNDIVKAKIELQKSINELEILENRDGYGLISGILKILENPFLLILAMIALIIGILLGKT